MVFVLELADDSITFECHGWRRAAVGLILRFFDTLMDPSNLTPDNLVVLQTLLPTQLRAFSMCFEEYLEQSSDDRRLILLGRLHRLRIVLQSWPGEL